MKNLSRPMTKSRSSRAVALAMVVALLSSTLAMFASSPAAIAQADGFGTASVTPIDAFAYVRGDLRSDSDQWILVDELIQRSGLPEAAGEEISVEDIAESQPDVYGEVAFVLTSIEADQTVDFDAVSEAASDPMSMGSDIPSGFSVVIQPEDVDAVAEELTGVLESEATEVEESEYNGVTISYAPPADEFSDGYAFAQINDETLALATLPEDLEPIIDTANGDIDPLTDNDAFTDLQDRLNTESILFGYVDGEGIIEQLLAIEPDAAAEIPADLVDQASGTVGFTFYAADEGFRVDSLLVPGENASFPELPTFSPSLDERVSAESLVFATGSDLGPSGALDTIALVFAQAMVESPDAAATPVVIEDPEAYAEEIFAQAEAIVGFNIKTDFVDQLVDEYAFSLSLADISSGTPTIDAVFVSGVEDETTVNDVISKFTFLMSAGAEEGTITSRDLDDGTSIYQANVGDESFPMVLEFGVIEGQLVIGINGGLDDYVEGPAETLADDPNYQAVFSSLPDEVTGAAFVNIPKIVPIIESFATSMSSSTPDNDPTCGEYATQEEAQEAYDEEFNFDLDQDFDGEACEDYFNPEASPEEVEPIELNILGVGAVTYDADGDMGQSLLIAIGD